MIRPVLFVIGSTAIVGLSWRSLGDLYAHGFYRFFAFEFLLALIVLNSPQWFRDSLSLRQAASYSLGVISIGLAVEGFRLLLVIGKPSVTAAPKTNLRFENTTALVSVGAYRFIRHPLYASLLALVWCAYLKNPLQITGILLTIGATGFLIATSVAEERENLARFGPAYEDYMKRTRLKTGRRIRQFCSPPASTMSVSARGNRRRWRRAYRPRHPAASRS